SLFLSVVVVEELEIGTLLAERRDPSQSAILRAWLEEHVLPAFLERILAVDTAVARRAATLHVPNPRPIRDGLIAATALVHGMALVTRNTSDFASIGVTLPTRDERTDRWRRLGRHRSAPSRLQTPEQRRRVRHPVGEAPLVVVPAHHPRHRPVHHRRLCRV